MSTGRLVGLIYILLFSLIYGLLNELVAYSELIMEYEQWNIVHPVGRMLIYLMPGVIAYVVFLIGHKYLLVLYFDMFLISFGAVWEGCDVIYVLLLWGTVKYGYAGLFLFWMFNRLIDLDLVDCGTSGHLDFILLVGLVGSVLIVVVMAFTNFLTMFVMKIIDRLYGLKN